MAFGGFTQRKAAPSSEYELRHFTPPQPRNKKDVREGKGRLAGLKLILLCDWFCIRASSSMGW